jgi:hypothetical protein
MKLQAEKKPRRKRNPNAKPKANSKPAPMLLADFHRLHPCPREAVLKLKLHLHIDGERAATLFSGDTGRLMTSGRRVEDILDWVEGRKGRQIAPKLRELIGMPF